MSWKSVLWDRIVACGRTEERRDGRTDGEIDATKLIVAFRNFAKASKNEFRFQMHSYHSDVTSTNHASATQLVLTLNYVSPTCKGDYYYTFIGIKFHFAIRTATANWISGIADVQSAAELYGAEIMLSANKIYGERLRDLQRPLITTQIY